MIKLGICNELFEGWDFGRVCRTVKEIGYDGLEIAPFTLAPRITDLPAWRLRELRSIVEDSGLETIGLHWLLAKTEGLYLTSPDPATRRATAHYLVSLAEATQALGGSVMVFGSPKQRDLLPGVNYHQAMDWANDVFSAAMPAISACGVDLCLEPLAPSETNFLTSIAQANDLIRRIDQEHFKLHLDVKAQSSDPGGSVPELFARYAPEAGHVHVQDPNLRGPGMGEVDFGPILGSLVTSGYTRWVSVEVFDYTPGAEETAVQSLDCLRRGLGRFGVSSA
ncbi:MAG: D-tagatose 3-epimerase [Planctomycetota bacterium]|nr:D-tagatose 3-epimerase [Planctomycetota bacterium]